MFVQTTSGVIYEVDVPAAGTNARELLDYQLASGDLTPVTDPVEKIDVSGGGYHWRRVPTVDDADTPAAKPGRKPKGKTADPVPDDTTAPADATPDNAADVDDATPDDA